MPISLDSQENRASSLYTTEEISCKHARFPLTGESESLLCLAS